MWGCGLGEGEGGSVKRVLMERPESFGPVKSGRGQEFV